MLEIDTRGSKFQNNQLWDTNAKSMRKLADFRPQIAPCVSSLGLTYLIPAAKYGSQVWGSVFVKQGTEFKSELQPGALRSGTLVPKAYSRCEAPLLTGQCCESVVMSPCSFIGADLWSSCTIACWDAVAQRLKRCFRLIVICTRGFLDAGLPRCWMDFKGYGSVMSMCKQYGVMHL
eukprot:1161690-Pelagomonas_calceolata.AAC.6